MPRPTFKEQFPLDDWDSYGRDLDEEIDALIMEIDREKDTMTDRNICQTCPHLKYCRLVDSAWWEKQFKACAKNGGPIGFERRES